MSSRRFGRTTRRLCVTVPFAVACLVFLAANAGAQTPSDPTLAFSESNSTLPEPPKEPEKPKAPDPPAAAFGAKGEWVLGGQTNVGLSTELFDASSATFTSYAFSPNLDYFLFDNLSLGLDVNLSYSDNKGYTAGETLTETKRSYIAFGPRVGWNIPLGKYASWWVTATFGVQFISTNQSPVPTGTSAPVITAPASTSQDGPYLSGYAPILFHVTPHVFFGLGPSVYHQFAAIQGGLNNGNQETTFGAGVLVGGYWGAAAPAAPSEASSTPSASSETPAEGEPKPPEAPLEPHRLGEKGQFVLTSNLVANLSSWSYAGSPASGTSGSLDLGFDYFVVDHFSMGLDLIGSFSSSTSQDANGLNVNAHGGSFGPDLRFGLLLPIAGPVSLWPRVNIGAAFGGYDDTTSTTHVSASTTEVYAGAYAPLTVQFAPHAFAGFGPSISHDLAQTVAYSNGYRLDNHATSIGAGFVVGGWL